MEKSRADRDEEELQEIMEKSPPPEFLKCFFCDNKATQYVEAEEVSHEVPREDVNGSIPVCDECYLDPDECMECFLGDFCEDHMTEEEYLLGKIVRDLFDKIDQEPFLDQGYDDSGV